MNWKLTRIVVIVQCLILCSVTAAQTEPWETFDDPLSDSVCDVVNSANDELVVISDLEGATGQLMIVTGPVDVLIQNSMVVLDPLAFVDEVFLWDVFIDNEFVGFLDFAEDGDGFGTFWWMSLTGRVIDFESLTLTVTESDLFPIDFVDVPCDALSFWDGCLGDDECADGNECTLDFCSAGVCVFSNLSGSCDDGDACTEFDVCGGGVCAGVPLFGCDDDGPPSITISFCGSNMGMAMMLTVFGLAAMRSRRRSGVLDARTSI